MDLYSAFRSDDTEVVEAKYLMTRSIARSLCDS